MRQSPLLRAKRPCVPAHHLRHAAGAVMVVDLDKRAGEGGHILPYDHRYRLTGLFIGIRCYPHEQNALSAIPVFHTPSATMLQGPMEYEICALR